MLVFRFDNPDRAIEALKAAGRDVLDAVTLFTEAKMKNGNHEALKT